MKPLYRRLILLLLAVLILFLLNFYQREVKNFFYKISEPIQKIFWRAGMKVSIFFETISEIKRLKSENEELKLKNQELLSQIANLNEFKKENENLREALGLGLEKEFKISLAQITSRDISQDFVVVNKGLKDGIEENMPVITSQKILVGKIYQVYKNYSRVMLITNKESSFGGRIVGKETLGEVAGKGNLKVIFDLIPPEKEISQGDIVETTVLGGVFPKGLLVGQIGKIQKSDIQSLYQAEILPLFDLDKLENVFIILND
jgi:rod shape-determining protein MreC